MLLYLITGWALTLAHETWFEAKFRQFCPTKFCPIRYVVVSMPCPSVLECLEQLEQLGHVLSVLNVLRNNQIDLIISGHLEQLGHFYEIPKEDIIKMITGQNLER